MLSVVSPPPPPPGLWPETWPPVVEKVVLSVRGITDISSQLRLSS